MAKIIYPLQDVLSIKHRRVQDAEKMLAQKKEALAKEEQKLKEREAERDKVEQHRKDKLQQMRDELDGGTTSPTVQQMKYYLEIVKEKLVIEEKKVEDQKKQVKAAEKEVEEAHAALKKRRDEVEKLETHKKDWLKTARAELDEAEQRELDELGSQMYLVHKQKNK